MKKILFIFRHSPYQSSLTKDGFDALLAAASFEQPLSVLFIDEGVWTLKNHQHANEISRKNLEKQLQSFSLYDIDEIYVDAGSLEKRSLSTSDLSVPVITLDKDAVSALFHTHKHVLSF